MNTLPHMFGALALWWMAVYAFVTLSIPVLGFALLAVAIWATAMTAMTAMQDAHMMQSNRESDDV